jgi:ribonuclease P protein component
MAYNARRWFKNILEKGNCKKGRYLVLYSLKGDKIPYKACFVITKKVSNSSVKRNRIRRILREKLRQYSGFIQGQDIVVFIKSQARDCSKAQLQEEMLRLLKK